MIFANHSPPNNLLHQGFENLPIITGKSVTLIVVYFKGWSRENNPKN